MSGWLLVAYGFAVGVILMSFGVWLPSRAYWRRQLDDLREIHRIQSGYRTALHPDTTQPLLTDAGGAFAAAAAAYIPIYPGRGEPEPAWVAWIERGGRRVNVERRDAAHRGYRPAHGSDLVATEPRPTHPPGFEQAVWGADWTPPTPRPVWDFRWAWHERLLVPLVLGLTWLDRPRRYPWWQKLLDRAWETGMVFETSGSRVNRRMVDGLDDMLAGTVDLSVGLSVGLARLFVDLFAALAEALATLAEVSVNLVGRVWRRATRRRTPHRPKRYYPIPEA